MKPTLRPPLRIFLATLFAALCLGLLSGCPTVARKAGQSELFVYHPGQKEFYRTFDTTPSWPWIETRREIMPRFGDRVRYASDTLLIQVNSVYLADKPSSLTNSSDVLLFAEVWENAAAGPSENPLTYILHAEKNQLIPGRLNFTGAIAYGPTFFKGHPLKIKFTLMIVQKEKGKAQSNVADVVSKYTASVPTYGAFLTPAAAVIRDVLRAQPDIIAFDYEAVLISDKPEKLSQTVNGRQGPDQRGALAGGPDLTSAAEKTALEKEEKAHNEADKKLYGEWNTWQKSYGWLQYGHFLIAETALRETDATNGKVGATQNQRNRYDRKKHPPLTTRGGWVLTGKNPTPGPDDLDNTYIVFSVVPGQISENGDTLREASIAASQKIGSLRQSEENVAAAMVTINQTAKDLKFAVVKSQAEALADRISKMPNMDLGRFNAEFSRQYADLVNSFGSLGEGDIQSSEIEGIRKKLASRYQSIFEDIKRGEIKSPEKAVVDAATEVTGGVLTTQETKLAPLIEAAVKLDQRRSALAVTTEALETLAKQEKALRDAIAGAGNAATTDQLAALKAVERTVRDYVALETQKTTVWRAEWDALASETANAKAALSAIETALTWAKAELDKADETVKTAVSVAATATASAVSQEDIEKAKGLVTDAAAFKASLVKLIRQYTTATKTWGDLTKVTDQRLANLSTAHNDFGALLKYASDLEALGKHADRTRSKEEVDAAAATIEGLVSAQKTKLDAIADAAGLLDQRRSIAVVKADDLKKALAQQKQALQAAITAAGRSPNEEQKKALYMAATAAKESAKTAASQAEWLRDEWEAIMIATASTKGDLGGIMTTFEAVNVDLARLADTVTLATAAAVAATKAADGDVATQAQRETASVLSANAMYFKEKLDKLTQQRDEEKKRWDDLSKGADKRLKNLSTNHDDFQVLVKCASDIEALTKTAEEHLQ